MDCTLDHYWLDRYIFLYSLLFVRRIEHSWGLRCARARTEMKRKTNNRLQHRSCIHARARVPSRPAMVRSRAKPLNEEKKRRMKNGILVWLASSSSLAIEHRGKIERKKNEETNWAMDLVCFSHFYSKWQGNVNRVMFCLFLSDSFSVLSFEHIKA